MIFISRFVFFQLAIFSVETAEIRAIHNSSQYLKNAMHKCGATYLGEYAFTDYIYGQTLEADLNKEFIRIRKYQKTKWDQKSIVVEHKLRSSEGNHKILLKKEFDSLSEAKKLIPRYFFELLSFSRHGWEYSLENLHIYIEEIEGMAPSIEVIAKTKVEILDFFKMLELHTFLQGSVAKYLQKRVSMQISQ